MHKVSTRSTCECQLAGTQLPCKQRLSLSGSGCQEMGCSCSIAVQRARQVDRHTRCATQQSSDRVNSHNNAEVCSDLST